MKSKKRGRPSIIWIPPLNYDEDQDQQHGVNSMVFNTGEKGDKKELVSSKRTQAKSSLSALVQGKPAQEELVQQANRAVEHREHKTEESGKKASKVSSGSLDKGNHVKLGHRWSAQQQLQQEVTEPEDIRNLYAWARLLLQYLQRFTYSQLEDLENYFQKTHYPRFSARKKLARGMGVPEVDVTNWFRIRRAIFRRSSTTSVFSNEPTAPQNNDP